MLKFRVACYPVLMAVIMPAVAQSIALTPSPVCRLKLKHSVEEYKSYKHGDVIIGGIFTVNFRMDEFQNVNQETIMCCTGPSTFNYKYFLNFKFAIEEVNKNPNILPNVTLGFHVYDSCSNANKAVKSVIQILSGPGVTVPNYYCAGEENIAGFIGDLLSVTTLPIAQMLSVYGYTQLNRYLKEVAYMENSEEKTYYDDKGELNTVFHMYNWIAIRNTSSIYKYVGSYTPWAPPDQQLSIRTNKIIWKNKNVPRSRCSEYCPPGTRKIKNNLKPICCYDCVACSEGEISNITDSEKCITCLNTEWSSSKRDQCFPKVEEFLAFSDGLSIALSSIALLFWTISVVIFGIFVSHKNTPIVKANNKNLSFILLISLSLCFLCVFLFIGRPVDSTCRLRQVVFGVIFSICVSSVLAKTILVYMAFKISRPGNRWKKLIGIRVSNFIVMMASFIEVIISINWLYFSPPYLEQDTQSYPQKIVIQCNEGSQVAFFAVLGYLFLLAAVSFIVAYLARTLPDRFNEAKYITFSMLVFCSVWITMVPSYLSTKGKHMVAVEMFSILASSAGLLSFLFFPKCYIIFVKKHVNTTYIWNDKLKITAKNLQQISECR